MREIATFDSRPNVHAGESLLLNQSSQILPWPSGGVRCIIIKKRLCLSTQPIHLFCPVSNFAMAACPVTKIQSRVDMIAVEIPDHRAFAIARRYFRSPILHRFSESPAELPPNARCKTPKRCCAACKHLHFPQLHRHRAAHGPKSLLLRN